MNAGADALVTGAAGFIGGGVARALAAHPGVGQVVGFDRDPLPAPSLRGDLAALADLAAATPPPAIVVHCAGITTAVCERDPIGAYAVNLEGTRHLLAWCAGFPRPPRLVFTSSVAVFGGGEDEVDEGSLVSPRSTYGAVKAAAELLVLDAARRGMVDGVVVRLPVTIVRTTRSGRPGAGYLSDLIIHAAQNRPLIAPLGPDEAVPVAASADVFALLVAAATRPDLPTRLLHVPARPVSGRQTVAALRARGLDPQVRFEPDESVRALMAGWPRRLASRHAAAWGLDEAAAVEAIVNAYLRAYHSSAAASRAIESVTVGPDLSS